MKSHAAKGRLVLAGSAHLPWVLGENLGRVGGMWWPWWGWVEPSCVMSTVAAAKPISPGSGERSAFG